MTGTGLGRLYARAKLVAGVVLPLSVLSVALVRVDAALLAATVVALGTVFGVTYAYARYVDFDAGPSAPAVDSPPTERGRD